MSFTSYVLMVVIDPATRKVVGLIKQKGPSHLIGKRTFPGGKREIGECPEIAASREILEEAGIRVNPSQWVRARYVREAHFEIYTLAAMSSDVQNARQVEEEPVEVWNLDEHALLAKEQPELYSHDFLPVLNSAKTALNL